MFLLHTMEMYIIVEILREGFFFRISPKASQENVAFTSFYFFLKIYHFIFILFTVLLQLAVQLWLYMQTYKQITTHTHA